MELTHFLIAMGSRFIPLGKSEAASHLTPEPVVTPSAPVITITTVSGETVGTTATEDEDSTEETEDSTEVKQLSQDIITSKFGGNAEKAVLDFLGLDKAPSKGSPINAKMTLINQILGAGYELDNSIFEHLAGLIESDSVSAKIKLTFVKTSKFIKDLSEA
jgi:hypothetical protein